MQVPTKYITFHLAPPVAYIFFSPLSYNKGWLPFTYQPIRLLSRLFGQALGAQALGAKAAALLAVAIVKRP